MSSFGDEGAAPGRGEEGTDTPDVTRRASSADFRAPVAIFYGAMAIIALVGRRFVEDAPNLLPTADAAPAPSLQVAAGLIAGALLIGSGEISLRFSRSARALDRWLRSLLGGLSLPAAILLALVSSAAEELLFRGLLLPVIGLLPSAILFGVVHMGPSEGRWWWVAWAVCAGLVFGALTLWTGSLLAAFVAHLTVNGVNLVRISSPSES